MGSSPTEVSRIKTHPDCLRLVTIAQKCKFEIATSFPRNVITREGKGALTRLISTDELVIAMLGLGKYLRRPQAKRVSLEKGVCLSRIEVSRMDSSAKTLKSGRIQYRKGEGRSKRWSKR